MPKDNSKQTIFELAEGAMFVTPPHMLRVTFPDGSVKIHPLTRGANGQWRRALDGTRGGNLPPDVQKSIEEAYTRHVGRVLLGDDDEN